MEPDVLIGVVSNLFSKQMHFRSAGDVMQGHRHLHDHLTLLAYGRLRVTIDEQTTEFAAPHMIYIRADKEHRLEALQDNTVAYCIHPLRDKDGSGDILDPSMIPNNVIGESLINAEPLIQRT